MERNYIIEILKSEGYPQFLLEKTADKIVTFKQEIADAFEALLAAMYLDGGLEPVEKFLLPLIKGHMAAENTDFKTVLQEYIQQSPGKEIAYKLIGSTGPDHEKVFQVAAYLDGILVGEGSGKSKKEAEQMAAKCALEGLKK